MTAAAVDVILRIAATQSADPATDDLTVPLAIENAKLATEITRLRADLADWQASSEAYRLDVIKIDSNANAKIERLQAALKPFADLAGKLDGAPNLIGLLTEEDFKRAAAALADEQSPGESDAG